jgi:hypothetical protein
MFNHTITIINKWYNATTKLDEYRKTILHNVSWNELKGANIKKAGYETADDYIIVIPVSSTLGKYKSPKGYQAMSREASQGFFTLQVGDKIIKGEVSDPITTTKALEDTYDSVMTITAVRNNSDNAINSYLNHFEVGGK